MSDNGIPKEDIDWINSYDLTLSYVNYNFIEDENSYIKLSHTKNYFDGNVFDQERFDSGFYHDDTYVSLLSVNESKEGILNMLDVDDSVVNDILSRGYYTLSYYVMDGEVRRERIYTVLDFDGEKSYEHYEKS